MLVLWEVGLGTETRENWKDLVKSLLYITDEKFRRYEAELHVCIYKG